MAGFDPALPLFRDDIDFGWRANLAGHRVVICSRAVVRHARAATIGRRRIACGPPQPRRLDRQGAIWTMLANCSGDLAAMDHAAGDARVRPSIGACSCSRSGRSMRGTSFAPLSRCSESRSRCSHARKARKATRRISSREIRPLFAPRGTRFRRYGDSLRERLTDIGHGSDDDGATDDRGLARRIVTQPGLLLVLGLLVVSLVAERHVLSGTPYGGMLLPAPVGCKRSVAHLRSELARHRIRQHDRCAAVSGDSRDRGDGVARQRATRGQGVAARKRADCRPLGLHRVAPGRDVEAAARLAFRNVCVAACRDRIDRGGPARYGGCLRRPAPCFVDDGSVVAAAAVSACARSACLGTSGRTARCWREFGMAGGTAAGDRHCLRSDAVRVAVSACRRCAGALHSCAGRGSAFAGR